MLLDYVLAFTVLGVATFFRKMKGGLYHRRNGCVRLPLSRSFHQRRHDLPHQRADRTVQLHLYEPVALFRCLQRQLCAHRPGSLPRDPCESCPSPCANTCAVTISRPCAANKPFFRKAPAKKAGAFSLSKNCCFPILRRSFQDSRRGGRLCPPDEQPQILAALCRGRCRSQPFATKERYGCGSAACRYTSARREVTNSPQISVKTVQSAGPMRHPQASFEAQPRIARL